MDGFRAPGPKIGRKGDASKSLRRQALARITKSAGEPFSSAH